MATIAEASDQLENYRVVKWKGATFRRWCCVHSRTGFVQIIWHSTEAGAARMAGRYYGCDPDLMTVDIAPLSIELKRLRGGDEQPAPSPHAMPVKRHNKPQPKEPSRVAAGHRQ